MTRALRVRVVIKSRKLKKAFIGIQRNNWNATLTGREAFDAHNACGVIITFIAFGRCRFGLLYFDTLFTAWTRLTDFPLVIFFSRLFLYGLPVKKMILKKWKPFDCRQKI